MAMHTVGLMMLELSGVAARAQGLCGGKFSLIVTVVDSCWFLMGVSGSDCASYGLVPSQEGVG